jgi:transcriptional regulator with XRE-family HTH domain
MKCKHCHGTGVAPDWKRLGAELRRRRMAAGMSLRLVSREGGCSAAHLSDMEYGRRTLGGPKARKILARFGLYPEWKP